MYKLAQAFILFSIPGFLFAGTKLKDKDFVKVDNNKHQEVAEADLQKAKDSKLKLLNWKDKDGTAVKNEGGDSLVNVTNSRRYALSYNYNYNGGWTLPIYNSNYWSNYWWTSVDLYDYTYRYQFNWSPYQITYQYYTYNPYWNSVYYYAPGYWPGYVIL